MASQTQKTVGKRGPTTLRKLKRKKGTDEKFELEWNSKGQAKGKNRSKFMSYIGVCARTLVDINFPRWDCVPTEVKESVWTAISDVFEVPADKQDWVIAIACERWRNFKSKLKRFFIYDKDENICTNPPSLYSFINQETWAKFIRTRQSDEFKEQSDKHRDIAKKNLYPYRGSRKGYVGIEEEIIQENTENTLESPLDVSSSTPIVPRSMLWKKARTDKSGNMDEPVRQVVAKMDSLSEQVANGEITLHGRQDILTTALGTKEHAGRVRGAGVGVTITGYFGRDVPLKNSSQLIERLGAMEEQVMALKCMVSELQSKKSQQSTKSQQPTNNLQPTKNLQSMQDRETTKPWDAIGDIARSYLEVPEAIPRTFEFPEGWSECELASPEPGHPIVATGKVFNTRSAQPVMLHNKPLEPGYMKVTIIDPKVQEAPLPMPTDEAYTVFEAVGAFIAWPTNLIFRNNMEFPLPSGDKDGGLNKQNESTVSKTLPPAQESQPTPLELVNRSAEEINDTNISTKGKKVIGRGKQMKRRQPEVRAAAPTIFQTTMELQLPSVDKDEGLNKEKEGTASKTLAPAPESQLTSLNLLAQSAAEINDSVFVKDFRLSYGKRDKSMSKQIQRTQTKALTTTPPTQPTSSRSNQVTVNQQQKLTTLTMKLMYRCARGMTCDDTITIDMPLTVWQDEHKILITKDELLQWLFQESVQASHVSVYIKYLDNLCREWDNSQMFSFLRPQMLTPDTNHGEEEGVQYIANAMKGAKKNQIYFAPYSDGRHWMLCAIHPVKDQAYWLDPAGNEAHPDVKKVIQMAIRKFYFQRRRKKPRGKTLWYEVKCPRQSNNDDSGYYLFRYMQEIIEKRQDFIPEQYYEDSPAPGAYEQSHIDEIRDKWIELVQNHMD